MIDEECEEREIQACYDELLQACRQIKPLTDKEEQDIFRAFSIAKKAHAGTRRKSGELYIFHPLAVALIAVREVGLGPIAVVCALLHDVVEDTEITLDELRMVFGERVATIVDGVTKIEDIQVLQKSESKQAENYRKILLSMCKDAYVIFLKLCDRLHNMRTLGSMKDTKKLAIASETQYLYIPLAHRLGLYNIKTELEELVMCYTDPDQYAEITKLIKSTSGTEIKLKECLTAPIREMLDAGGFKYRMKTRVKSPYSCWKKMQNKGVSFDEIYDLYAMRIILDVPPDHEKEECFKVYALISSKFPPNPSRFRDWITTPKNNGYESLQTTVMTPIGRWVEIQIRTERMDSIAEKGMAAHFLYKEAHPEEIVQNSPVEDWLLRIRATLKNTEKSALDLVEEFKETLYTKEIYLFTPKGETIMLPSNSTVLDFAFFIHTDLGLHCIGAKVNSRVVPAGYLLQSGEQVQILTSRKTTPSEDWLTLAHTPRAKDRIKDWLREQRKDFHDKGEQRLKALFKAQKIYFSTNNLARLKNYLHYTNDVDFYYYSAIDTITDLDVARCFGKVKPQPRLVFLKPYTDLFNEQQDAKQPSLDNIPKAEGEDNAKSFLLDKGYEDFVIEPAPCCKPVQGDQVIGIASDGKIVVHRTNCKVAMNEMANHENNVVRAKWREGENVSFLTGVTITAIDRKGLLQELTSIITQDMNLNMRAITLEASESVVRGIIMLYINDLTHLNHLMDNMRAIDGVEDVRRL